MTPEDVFGIVGSTQAGNFHVERVVAEGGFGVVYRAQHGGFRAPVALKCLKIPDEMSKHQRAVFLEKFREEAELMFRLSAAIAEVVRPLHVDVLQLGDGRFVPFLALEWLEGESLHGIITRRHAQGQAPFGIHKLVKLLRPVAHALSRAHRFPAPEGTLSIVHRDLKPENIFVATIGGVDAIKILDFGIAKAKSAASQAAGRIAGASVDEDEMSTFTPAYGAPEQWVPKRYGETGPWTDVWGLALTMVEALSGTPPIDGDTFAMRRAILDEKRRPTPHVLGVVIAPEVERVLSQALAVDPKQRFKDMESFWSELELAMGLEPSLGPRDRRRELGPSDDAAPETPLSPARDRRRESSPSAPGAAKLARIELTRVERPLAGDGATARKPGQPITGEMAPIAVGRASSTPIPDDSPPRAPEARPQEDFSDLEFDLGGPEPAPTTERSSLSGFEPPAGIPAPKVERAAPPPPAAAPKVERAAPPPQAAAAPIDRAPAAASRAEPVPTPRAAATPRAAMSSLEADLPMFDEQRDAEPPPSQPPSSKIQLALELAVRPRAVDEEDEIALESVRPPKPTFGGAVIGTVRRPSSAPPPSMGARGFDLAANGSDRRAGERRAPPSMAPEEGTAELRSRLRAPLQVLMLALAVSLGEISYNRITGTVLMLGPLRPFWITAPLAVLGLVFTLWRLIGESDGESKE